MSPTFQSDQGPPVRTRKPRAVELPAFGGLNLRDDPQEIGWSGAVDLLNVDFDDRGRVRSRDGFAPYTASAAAFRYASIYAVPLTNTVMAVQSFGVIDALQAGAVTASSSSIGVSKVSFATVGTPTSSYVYAASASAVTGWRRYDLNAATWSTPAGMPTAGGFLAVQPNDNRLVMAGRDGKIRFSGAGTPETWGTNDYVQVTPGDNERVTAAVAWQNYLFVFKRSKLFVFYGNQIDGSGNPVFNYRTITGAGSIEGGAVATPQGVYFIGSDGVYLTTGGEPRRVSSLVTPLFTGDLPATYGGDAVSFALTNPPSAMTWCNDRLYMTFAAVGSTTNSIVLVFEPATDTWSVWDLPAAGLTTLFTERQSVLFSYATGANHVGVVSDDYTTDDGAEITTRHQTGFADLGTPGADKIVHPWLIDGEGTVNVSVATDDGTPDPARAQDVTLGAGAVAEGRHTKSYRGRNFSIKLADSSGEAWRVSRVIARLKSERSMGLRS